MASLNLPFVSFPKVSFKGLSNYNNLYSNSDRHNGLSGDVFISSKLQEYYSDSTDIEVIDIGAGDGKNSIPISEKGYDVTSTEISEAGRKRILSRAKEKGLNVEVLGQNILNEKTDKKYDFGIMSLVTQHFSEQKLAAAFSNIGQMMKSNGIFVFNALIRNKGNENLENYTGNEYSGDYSTENSEEDGTCHFKEQDVLDNAKKEGFEVKEIADYNEPPESRPKYVNSRRWGMSGNKLYDCG